MNVIPRCRTMIEPAGTSCPSPTFTPRRWPALSRPFFELEPAFLWAMSSYSSFFVRLRFGAAFVWGAGVFAVPRFGAAAAAPAVEVFDAVAFVFGVAAFDVVFAAAFGVA